MKPIVHGTPDPFEVPYWCRRCIHFVRTGSEFPHCDFTENGRFSPDITFSCRKLRPVEVDQDDKIRGV